MRKRSKLVITVFILVVLFLLVIPLYPNISTNIAGDANGGSSEIWVLNLHFGAYVSFTFHTYYLGASNNTSILFSINNPDGSYLIHNVNVSSIYSYSFVVDQVGNYAFNFSDPHVGFASVFQTATNITVLQPVLGQYFIGVNSYTAQLPEH